MSPAVTGERVMTTDGGFNPTWQRHVAAHALCGPRLDQGRIADVGCGIGHSYRLLAPRETVGIDLEPAALEGQERPTVVADMRALPFEDGEFDGAISVHSIEHIPDAAPALAEMRRVVRPGGMVLVITPNRLTFAKADEIIDPYHYTEYDPAQLEAACRSVFDSVEMGGTFGSERYQAIVARDHAKLDALLRLDPLRVRRAVPRRVLQWLYDWQLSRERADPDPEAAAITVDDFHLGTENLAACLDVAAFCRSGDGAGPPPRESTDD